jgi:Ni,Fe-hydrogenase maturation factor
MAAATKIMYLKNNLKADIIALIIQPKSISFGDSLSPEVASTIDALEKWFYETELIPKSNQF